MEGVLYINLELTMELPYDGKTIVTYGAPFESPWPDDFSEMFAFFEGLQDCIIINKWAHLLEISGEGANETINEIKIKPQKRSYNK